MHAVHCQDTGTGLVNLPSLPEPHFTMKAGTGCIEIIAKPFTVYLLRVALSLLRHACLLAEAFLLQRPAISGTGRAVWEAWHKKQLLDFSFGDSNFKKHGHHESTGRLHRS